ncbi:hypothetical protein [Pseudomonas putida]|uniref:Uncharacterized protein n=1 Tax=Pseudomonas putida TaxID=303 RepID=A0A8I1EIL9_PSEPU|nr:hypothetical protein [Pseudomonas putida]MBI6885808.1 hypothetical protein [Pseudomonas putida]
MTTPNSARHALSLLLEDFPEDEALHAKIQEYLNVLPAPDAEFHSVSKPHLENLVRAAGEVISYTEAEHRPPVRDAIEHGRMALVRIHALADLLQAVLPFDSLVKPSLMSNLPPLMDSRQQNAYGRVEVDHPISLTEIRREQSPGSKSLGD